MESSNQTLPPDFDAWTQTFTLFTPDGEPFNVTMGDINEIRIYGSRLAINYGSQIGASFLLFLIMFLLTNREKRRSWIFVLNALCLVLNVIRSSLQACWLVTEYFNPYTVLAHDFARVTAHDRSITIASNVMNAFLIIGIMVSLSLQVRVVCVTTPRIQRFWIMAVTSLIALNAVAWRFAVTVVSNQQTMLDKGMEPNSWLLQAQYITMAIAIWVYCVVFTFKLGYALVQRRKLGMSQFGPMQIIFIMGCQTMVLPAIFTILQFQNQIPELGSQTLTIVCIFLPLSAIWAGVIANDPAVAACGPDAHHRLLAGQMGRWTANSSTNRSNKTTLNTLNSMKEPDNPTTPLSPYREREAASHNGSLQVNVQREWTVEQSPADQV